MNRSFFRLPAAVLIAGFALSAVATAQVTLPTTIPRVPLRHLDSTDQADAEADVSLARRTLHTFCPNGSLPPAGPVAQYTASVSDLQARNYNGARTVSVQAIDQCAALQTAAIVQEEASPSPSP